jgi:ribosomal protein L40E
VDTHLFQALTLGLLLIVIVVLLVVVSMLGKVRAALEGRAPARSSTAPGDEPETAIEARDAETVTSHDAFAAFEAEEGRDAHEPVAHAVEELPAETPAPVETAVPVEAAAPVEATPVEAAAPVETVVDDEPDSERPFERGGRWYFRRSGELLVYEEGTGEWVPAGASPEPATGNTQPSSEGGSDRAREEVVPAASETAPEPASTERAPSTSFGGQPVASEDAGELAEPLAGTVDVEPAGAETAEFEVTEAQEEAALAHQTESFWKCPSCGAVNGSTAATCRMCFTPRP